jgi:hypothetical protein
LNGGGQLTGNVTLNANLSNALPLLTDGLGSAGVSNDISRADHQHPSVNLQDSDEVDGVLSVANGGTSRSIVPDAGAVIWSGADGLYVGPVGLAGQVLVSGGTGAPTWGSALIVSDQTANVVYAGPAAGPAAPTGFRSLVINDLPASGASAGTYGSQAVVPVITVNSKGQVTSAINTTINAVTLTSGSISNAPTNGTDLVNKNYADSIATGINFHQACRLATAAALPANTYNNGSSGVGATLTANVNGALSVDGVAVVVGNRVLIKNEVVEANNGVYVVTQTGSAGTPYILTRATDFDSAGTGVDQIDAGDFFLITAGSTNANTSWVQQTPLPITVGTTAIVFSQFGAAGVTYTAGTGLTLTGTVFSITNTAVAAASYGSASSVATFSVNAQGQLTTAATTAIAIANTQVSGLGTMSTQNANSVAITGGAIDGATVGATTATTVRGTTVTATTQFDGPGTGLTGTATSLSIGGNAATATVLQTARTIGGVSFNGSVNIDLPGVNTAGNQNTSGNAATATTATNATNVATTATSTNANFFIPFVAASTTGNQALGVDAGITYNPSTNALTASINGGTF